MQSTPQKSQRESHDHETRAVLGLAPVLYLYRVLNKTWCDALRPPIRLTWVLPASRITKHAISPHRAPPKGKKNIINRMTSIPSPISKKQHTLENHPIRLSSVSSCRNGANLTEIFSFLSDVKLGRLTENADRDIWTLPLMQSRLH